MPTNLNLPENIQDLNFAQISQIRAGTFSCAVSSQRELFVWGRGVFGEFHIPHRVKSASNLGIMDVKISKGGIAIVLTH